MPTPELSRLEQALTPKLTRYIPHAPTPPQTAFLLLDVLEAFYGGAAGGGKSDALLMAGLQYVDVPGYSALILRRTFPELSQPGAIMARSHEWLAPWRSHGVGWNEQKKRWTFTTGDGGTATLTFGYLRSIRDVYQYQGAEFQFIGFDELTQFPEEPYTYLFSRLRRPESGPLSRVPLRMRAASNPGNVGHGWVKKRLVAGETRTGVFIPAKLKDNPHLDQATYVESLSHLPDVTQAQLLEGDWGAFEGAAYPIFDRSVHVVPQIELPDSWQRWEAMDHGVTNPTAWGLFASDYDGNVILCDTHYQPGLPEEHAEVIKARRADWWQAREDGWPQTHPAYGDPMSLRESLPIQNDFGQPLSLQEHYQKLGIRLIPANNRRKVGFIEILSRLKPDPARRFPLWHPKAGEPGAPSLFIVETCVETIDQLENAPLASGEHDPNRGEAVDAAWESANGHGHAMLRYGLTQRSSASEEPEVEPEDPRTAMLRRRQEQRRRGPRDRNQYQEL